MNQIPNPLASLISQLGISGNMLAGKIHVPPQAVEKCLKNPPEGVVKTYCQLIQFIGARMYVEAAPPLVFWVATPDIDALWTENRWRKGAGLCPLPRNNIQLRELIAKKRGDGLTADALTRWLPANFVPNFRGKREWHIRSIFELSQGGKPRPSDGHVRRTHWHKKESRLNWRRHVVSRLLAIVFEPDPLAPLKYGFDAEYGDQYVVVRGTKPMPACIRQWMEYHAQKMCRIWFDNYGLGEPPALIA
jgi:hypothetical protein